MKVDFIDWKETDLFYKLSDTRYTHQDFPIFDILLSQLDPINLFYMFITPEIIDMMIQQTNLYAWQYLQKNKEKISSQKYSGVKRWKNIDEKSIKTFLGLDILMGIHSNSVIEGNQIL